MWSIREVGPRDVAALTPLKWAIHALHVENRPDVFKPMDHAQIGRWLQDRLAEEGTHAWMATETEAPLGYILVAARSRQETSFALARRWFEIDEIIVEPAARRAGVGRALLERAVAHATEAGVGVELSTWAFNDAAQTAFVSAGFVPMTTRHEFR